MANRYWVGGSGNWSDDDNHWATSSGGVPANGNVPTSSDNVIFDTLSHTAGYTVTVDATANCADLTFGAPLTGTITWAGSSAMNVYGSLTLLAGMTRSYTGTITFAATSSGKTITTNGVSTSSTIVFDGAGGGWTLQDDLGMNGNLNLTRGTLNTNARNVTGIFSFNSNVGTTRSLDMRGSTLNILNVWAASSSLSLTIDTSSVISFTGTTTFTGGGLTYNDVVITPFNATFINTNTFRNLTITGQDGTRTNYFTNDQTVTGTFTLTGSGDTGRPLCLSNVFGTARTITAAAVSLADVDFRDITGAGAASFTGTRLGDCKGNSGITFTAAANKYWIAGTGTWVDATNHWATSSGGAGGANNYPLPQDTAIFDANSFSADGQTLTLNGSARGGTIDMSAIDQNAVLGFGNLFEFYGDITLKSGMTSTGTTSTVYFRGRTTQNITGAGVTFPAVTNENLGGTTKLLDNFVGDTTRRFTHTYGTLDLNGFTADIGNFESSNSNTRTITFGSGGKIITRNTGASAAFNCSNSTGLTVDYAGGSISVEGNTSNTRTFSGGSGVTWPAVAFVNTTAGGGLNFAGSNTYKSFAASTDDTAQTIRFTAGTTTTILDDDGFFSGTSGALLTIGSITAANHTLSFSGSGRINSSYLSISRSTATPADKWYAGTTSTDEGLNSGWIFDAFENIRATFAGAGSGTFGIDVALPYDFLGAGVGTLTASLTKYSAGVATFSGAGTFVASLSKNAEFSASGIGTLAVHADVRLAPDAAFTGAGTLTANLVARLPAVGSLSGAGAFTAGTLQLVAIRAVLAGAGLFTANTLQTGAVYIFLNGAGGLNARVSNRAVAVFSAAGAGGFLSRLRLVSAARANFSGTGSLTARAVYRLAVRATFGAVGGLTANLSHVKSAGATLSGSSSLNVFALRVPEHLAPHTSDTPLMRHAA